ncbi:nuclear transport factor 2 family protein [Usitatibacter palustris]|uniref:DUF4440 domain-containing protein n=1 Tax=Usitatibacter palustris TaxID=2732487 RepID=A0A6M4HA51_9PROT|nr:nuclear transport factor 2 family protein [Usitatibacter palustris]QJR14927.1 hypothetical protein DSM104440_01742 [Usitatibacter palustris]
MKKSLAALVLAVTIAGSAAAQSPDAASVVSASEALVKAMMSPDRAALEKLLWPELSYGHSGGAVDTQATLIDGLVNKKSILANVQLTNATTTMVGNDLAVTRGRMSLDVMTTGTAQKVEFNLLMVWQKRAGEWRLLVRQASKL